MRRLISFQLAIVISLVITMVVSLQAINQNAIKQLVGTSVELEHDGTDDDDASFIGQNFEEELHPSPPVVRPHDATLLGVINFPVHLDMSPQSHYLRFQKPPSA